MKKFFCMSLALLMLLCVLAGCNGSANDTDPVGTSGASDVEDPTETEYATDGYGQTIIETDPVMETLDFEGVEIGIASRGDTQYIREFGVETQTDILDTRIFKRNVAVEKFLDVKLVIMSDDKLYNTDGLVEYVTNEYRSGVNSALDVVAAYGAYANHAALRGFYVNLLGDELPYMDLSKGYWNQDYVKNGEFFGQLYCVVGDINLTVYDKSLVTFTNLNLAASNGISTEELYKTVEDGKWNHDYMFNIVNNFSYMDNNDNNVVDAADTVSITSCSGSEAYDGFVRAWDLQFLKTNDDGTHTIVIDGNTKLEAGVTMLRDLYSVQGVFLDDGITFVPSFIPGNALFCIDILYRNAESNTQLRNANFDYAILPLPMYDEDQYDPNAKNLGYLTTPQDAYNAMSVLGHHEEKLEAISATLELLSAKSYEDIRPFYIEKMVKATYISGAKPIKMLELAINGSSFDTALVYYVQTDWLTYNMWRAVCNKEITVAERWAAKREGIEAAVKDLDAWFMATAE